MKNISIERQHVGYYLDIHSGYDNKKLVAPAKIRELLLGDGAREVDDGTIWFAGGGGHVVTERDRRRQQPRRRDGAWVDGIQSAMGTPAAAESKLHTGQKLAVFRFSWVTDTGLMRECLRKLLEFCRRHGFRLYDGQIERYIDETTVDLVIAALARGRAWVEQVLPLPDHPIGGAASHGTMGTPASDQDSTSRGPKRSAAGLDTRVEDLDISVRARAALRRLNVRTVGELSNQTTESLLTYKNLGRTALKEIEHTLAAFGLTLRRSEASADGVSGADKI